MICYDVNVLLLCVLDVSIIVETNIIGNKVFTEIGLL